MTRKNMASLLFASVLAFSAGCVADQDKFGTPNLLHPGHISEQQAKMRRFDPFTRSDIGPSIPGDRPSGSTAPTPSSQHIQEYKESRY